MQYIEVKIAVPGGDDFRESLIANLLMIGFDSFMETEQQVVAYIGQSLFKPPLLEQVIANTQGQAIIEGISNLADQNWNALWESNYEPVIIDERVIVRAPFHQAPHGMEFDIIIQPKMSFGTAHHGTTILMIQFLLETDLKGKAVLDMGSGTGVLAILAAMKGANPVIAIDNDDWAFQNASENCERNHVSHIKVIKGDATAIPDYRFEVVLANINRNILLNDMPAYDQHLAPGATVLLSGFYEDDVEIITAKASSLGWKPEHKRTSEKWVALYLVKDS